MAIDDKIAAIHDEMTQWRQSIHNHPETAFEEVNTAAFVTEKLKEFGVDEIETGMAETGVVAVIRGKGESDRAIGLRADMDALHVQEKTNTPYSSKVEGKMHACGHDGHTAMLLGAAKRLADTRDFSGTAYLIFQPAEEGEGGGRVMVEEGLFKKYPMESVYGMHNWPGAPVGSIGMRAGPMMASADIFEILVTGKGAHAAMPHQGCDPVVVAAQIVTGLQTISSRNLDPLKALVISVTQIHGGDAFNVIPEQVEMRGTVRAFEEKMQDLAEEGIQRVAESVARSQGAEAEVRYERRYPPTVNSDAETRHAAEIAARVVGEENVATEVVPVMGSEDFSFMLQEKPGCYIWLGAGEESANLHSPHFDFNDEILPFGASYWVRLVEDTLTA